MLIGLFCDLVEFTRGLLCQVLTCILRGRSEQIGTFPMYLGFIVCVEKARVKQKVLTGMLALQAGVFFFQVHCYVLEPAQYLASNR